MSVPDPHLGPPGGTTAQHLSGQRTVCGALLNWTKCPKGALPEEGNKENTDEVKIVQGTFLITGGPVENEERPGLHSPPREEGFMSETSSRVQLSKLQADESDRHPCPLAAGLRPSRALCSVPRDPSREGTLSYRAHTNCEALLAEASWYLLTDPCPTCTCKHLMTVLSASLLQTGEDPLWSTDPKLETDATSNVPRLRRARSIERGEAAVKRTPIPRSGAPARPHTSDASSCLHWEHRQNMKTRADTKEISRIYF
ncbi:hypothetical protein E5288_WYG007635 [Bos mutus]|uniref:Uncharacterized protein n=1 Tax=Bos mutus TaxID=72004 RepID=A0A6B0RAG5_9CETA|nr:hypothetical protein [Bos mutus]